MFFIRRENEIIEDFISNFKIKFYCNYCGIEIKPNFYIWEDIISCTKNCNIKTKCENCNSIINRTVSKSNSFDENFIQNTFNDLVKFK